MRNIVLSKISFTILSISPVKFIASFSRILRLTYPMQLCNSLHFRPSWRPLGASYSKNICTSIQMAREAFPFIQELSSGHRGPMFIANRDRMNQIQPLLTYLPWFLCWERTSLTFQKKAASTAIPCVCIWGANIWTIWIWSETPSFFLKDLKVPLHIGLLFSDSWLHESPFCSWLLD